MRTCPFDCHLQIDRVQRVEQESAQVRHGAVLEMPSTTNVLPGEILKTSKTFTSATKLFVRGRSTRR